MTTNPNPAAIEDVADPGSVRVMLYASTQAVHAPLSAVVKAGAEGGLLPDGGSPGDVLTKNVDGTPEWGRIEADGIATTAGGTFEGDSVEDVLDDHEGRIVDVEGEVALAVRYDAQSASSGEQAQARANIGLDDTGVPPNIGDTFKWNGSIWVPAPSREVLTADRTYYVRFDGDDSNNGLANTSGGAFQTIQRAIDEVYSIDLSIFDVTIQLQDGTWTEGVTARGKPLGTGTVTIVGNVSSPASVLINTSEQCFRAENGASITVSGMELRSTDACLMATDYGSTITIGPSCRFGPSVGGQHMWGFSGGKIFCRDSYTISGGAFDHYQAQNGGLIDVTGQTITLTGTPAFGRCFARAAVGGLLIGGFNTYNGSATGRRYQVIRGGGIDSNVSGENYFPGDTAGIVSTAGWYA